MESLRQFNPSSIEDFDRQSNDFHTSNSPLSAQSDPHSSSTKIQDTVQPKFTQDFSIADAKLPAVEPTSVIGDAFGSVMKTMFGIPLSSPDPEIQDLMDKAFPPAPPMDYAHPTNDAPQTQPHNFNPSTLPTQPNITASPINSPQDPEIHPATKQQLPHIFVYKHTLLPQGFFTMDLEKFIQIHKSLPGGEHIITTSIDEARQFCLGALHHHSSQPTIHPPHTSTPPPCQTQVPMGPTPPLYPPTQPFRSPSQPISPFQHRPSPHGPGLSNRGNPHLSQGHPAPHPHFPTSGSSAFFPSIPSGFEHLFLRRKNFVCPEWDGDPYTWFETKTKIITALHDCDLAHLLHAPSTDPSNADGSRVFAVGMLKKFRKDALAYFLGPHSETWHTHGVEMWKHLLARYEPTSPAALLSLTKDYSSLKQEDTESFTSFLRRLNYLVHRLAQCNDRKDPTVVVSKAIDAMHEIYSPIYQSIACGQAMPIHDLQELEARIHNFDRLQGRQPGSPPKTKMGKIQAVTEDKEPPKDKNPKPTPATKSVTPQIMTGTDHWNSECVNILLSKPYNCVICRMKNHSTASCSRLKTLLQSNGFDITKLAPNPSLAKDLPEPAQPSSILKKTATFAQLPQKDKASAVYSDPLPVPPEDAPGVIKVSSVTDSLGHRLTFNKTNNVYVAGSAKSISSLHPNDSQSHECVIDSGATSTMWPYIEDFITYKQLDHHCVTLANNSQVPCLGIGSIQVLLQTKMIVVLQVLHVPALRCPLYSIRRHRRQLGCEFIATNEGTYLTFPSFFLSVDDSHDCVIPWSRVPSHTTNSPDYVYNPSDQSIKNSSAHQVRTRTHHKTSKPSHKFNINDRVQYLDSSSVDSFVSTIDKIIYDDFGDPAYGLWDPNSVRIWAVSSDLTLASPSVTTPISTLSPTTTSEIDDLLQPSMSPKHAVLLTDIDDFSPYRPTSTKLNSSEPSKRRFTLHDLHRYFGFRQIKDWTTLLSTGQPTIDIINTGDPPMEIGDVANIKASRRNKTPLPRPQSFLDVVHMDIGFGDCVSHGGYKYVILFVDRATRETFIYGVSTLSSSNLIKVFQRFFSDAKGVPKRILTDFESKILNGPTGTYLQEATITVEAAPPKRQHQNGLVERTWQTIVYMGRSYLNDMQMPRKFWFWALRHAVLLINLFPVTVNGELTTPHELAWGIQPDYRVLCPLFATCYFNHRTDGTRKRDGIAEAQTLQGILLGRSGECDGYIIFSPATKQFYHAIDVKIDHGRNTSQHFNLRYDGGIYIGLYDSKTPSDSVESFPPGLSVWYHPDDGPTIAGTITSSPIPIDSQTCPGHNPDSFYDVHLVTGDHKRIHTDDADRVLTSKSDDTNGVSAEIIVPGWIHPDTKIQLLKDGEYHKGYLAFNEDTKLWSFESRKRNGSVNWAVPLPQFISQWQSYYDDGTIIPTWKKGSTFIFGNTIGLASQAQACPLSALRPRYLQQAMIPDHPDYDIWISSYTEEYDTIMANIQIMNKTEFHEWRKKNPDKPILPTVCPLTVKIDMDGNPLRAKSRICVMGNYEPRIWSKGEKYSPVISQMAVRFLISLAIRNGTVLKQGDFKNAFAQADLPDDEQVALYPPPGCPFSPPGTRWVLKKSLYGLSMAARHWFDLCCEVFQSIGLTSCPNEPCIFYGTILPNHPPIYVGLFVDDIIYFSKDPSVEHHFEKTLQQHLEVKFMGQADWYLGMRLDWGKDNNGNPTCFLSQDAYVQHIVNTMKLSQANTNVKMTPYRSGFPIDSIPHQEYSENDQKKLTKLYQSFVGMLNWLAISTRPDISPVVSLLSTYNSKPSKGHLDAARHVGRYLKSTPSHGIFFSNSHTPIEGYVHSTPSNEAFQDLAMCGFADSNWGPQDASVPSDTTKQRPVTIEETKSLHGYLIYSFGSLVAWKCLKEKRISQSSCEAEIKATNACANGILSLRHILEDIDIHPTGPTQIFSDNQGGIEWCKGVSNKNMRHYNIKENVVRDMVQNHKELTIQKIAGTENPADICTKEHKSDAIFIQLRDMLVIPRP